MPPARHQRPARTRQHPPHESGARIGQRGRAHAAFFAAEQPDPVGRPARGGRNVESGLQAEQLVQLVRVHRLQLFQRRQSVEHLARLLGPRTRPFRLTRSAGGILHDGLRHRSVARWRRRRARRGGRCGRRPGRRARSGRRRRSGRGIVEARRQQRFGRFLRHQHRRGRRRQQRRGHQPRAQPHASSPAASVAVTGSSGCSMGRTSR